jgi:hypothetical protein
VRFGPDVEWVDTINYDVDPRRAESFYAAIREYWPGLPDGGALQPAYACIRPKLSGPASTFAGAGRGVILFIAVTAVPQTIFVVCCALPPSQNGGSKGPYGSNTTLGESTNETVSSHVSDYESWRRFGARPLAPGVRRCTAR